MRPTWTYKLGSDIMLKQKEEKDLGVVVQNKLLLEKHIYVVFGDAYRMLRNIRMMFYFLGKDIMKQIITTIRPKLEYAEFVLYPFEKKLMNCKEYIE